jgi:hypothetical protein
MRSGIANPRCPFLDSRGARANFGPNLAAQSTKTNHTEGASE